MGKKILINAVYLLALINPVSKISILSVFSSKDDAKEIVPVAMKSSLIALGILLLMILRDFILRQIFHVELYSLNIAEEEGGKTWQKQYYNRQKGKIICALFKTSSDEKMNLNQGNF